MKFLLDIKLDYEDIDFVFYDSEGYAECLIKPFPCLKREIEELGLC